MTTASIQSLQNGITPVNDASRDDLVLSDVVTVTSLNVGTAYQWTIAFKPEGSAAVFTSTGDEDAVNRSPGTFTVDVDGPYLIRLAYSTPQITLNTVLAAGVTFTINGVLLTAVAVARTPGNNDFSVATGTIAGITAEIVAALNDGANAFTAANVAGTDASPSVVINPIAETVPTGETVTITYSGTASDVTVAAFVTEQYVRLRSLTAFGDLKLVAAGERYDTLRVPVDAQPAGWADNQNYNLNQILSLISSTEASTGVVYVDPINGDFQTIQAAMDYATAQTPTLAQQWVVLVRPGTYVEDLTFYPWVHLFGWPGGEATPLVKVQNATVASHDITLPGPGSSLVLCNLRFERPAVSPLAVLAQGGGGTVRVVRCQIEGAGAGGAFSSFFSGLITFTECEIVGGGVAAADYALNFEGNAFLERTNVTATSCIFAGSSASSVRLRDCTLTATGSFAINSRSESVVLEYCTVEGDPKGVAQTMVNAAGLGAPGDLSLIVRWSSIEDVSVNGQAVVGTAEASLGASLHDTLASANGGVISASVPADTILYDNTTSGLAATNVQDAIDEVYAYAQLVRTLDDAYDGGIVGTGSGRTIIADQGAVQIVDALAPSDPVPPGNTNGNLEVVGSVKLGALTKAEITIDPNPFDNGPAILLGKEIWANDAPYGSTALILGDASGNPTFHNYNLRVGTKEASGGNQVGSVFVRAGDSLTAIDAGAVYLQGGTATDAGGGVGGDIIVVPGETAAGGARAMVLANPLTATSATLTAAGAFSGAAVAGTLTLGTETGAITVTFVGGEVLAAVHALFDATGIVTAAGDPIVLTTVMKGGTAEAFFLNETPAGVDAALGTFSGQAMVSGTWPDTVELGASAPGTFIVGVNAANPMLYDTATGKLTVPGLIDPTGVIFDEAGQPATGAAKGAVFVSDGSVGVQNDLYYADQAGVLVNISAAAAGVTNHAALTNLSWLLSAHIGANGSLATFDGATGAATLLTGVAQGDLAYFDGTDWTRLAPGAAGQLLQTQGIGADPIWAAGVGTDELVKVTANDTTPGYLFDKLITATTGVTWTEINNGADEDLRLDVSTASTAGQGLIEIATQAEVDGGADTTRAVTPAALASATTVIKPGDAPTGDLGGTYPNPMVTDFTIAGEAQGSVLYFNGVNWSQLSPGVAGQVLQTQGVGANPLWAAGGAGSSDHATLSNLLWTASAHTGTASRIAAFDGGGAASYVQVGVDVQAWDTDLDALAALATTGLLVRTGAGTATTRSIVQPAAGITVTNANGVAGDPTLALADDLAALEALAGTGIAVRTAANTWAERTLTGTLNRITVTNGDGVAGNPTLDVGSNVLVSGDAAGGDLSGTYPNPTVTDLTLTSEAQGTLAYFSGTNWVVLPVGTNGQLLQTQGAGANPQWVTSSGGGVTNTVVGSLGITNVGTNTDADLTPTYGAIASTVTEGNDARLSDARVPTGAAGGSLTGTYPNPGVADGADGTAIHDNVAGEILAVVVKLTPVSADVLLIEDSADANNKKRITVGTLPTGGGGEANTASNVGTAGVGLFKQKTGIDLEFKKVNAGSAKITITDDVGNDEVDVDVADASTTQAGAIELATQAEVDGLVDTTRAIVPSTLAGSTLAGDVTANNAKITNATHTGDVTGATVLTIAADVVTNAKLANVATATFKGRVTAATGDPEDLNGTQATTLLDLFTPTLQGVVPLSGGVATDFLSADGTWSVPTGTGGVTNTVVGSLGITNVGTNTDADLAPTYGTTASTVTQGNDARLSDARVPTGAAGGELGGTYPNPTVNDGADATAIHDNVASEISAVAVKLTPASGDFILIEDSAAGNAKKRITVGTLPTGGGGEANTGSNVNVGGVGVFKQKTGVDLEFRGINAASAKATVVLDAGNNEIDIDVADASETQAGAIEIATQAEVDGLTDTTRAIVPATLAGSILAGDVTTNNAKVTNATHTGDVAGATVLTIGANKVLNTMLADVASATFKGRITAALGDPEDLTGTQATTLLDLFSPTLQGVVPLSGGVATDFLSADGSWSVPAGTATLQTAYAGLNTILSSAAEGGPVAITTTVDETNAGLSVTAGNHTVATAQTLVSLTGDAEQTGDVQAIVNPGTGKALSISTTGAAQAGAAAQIDIQGTFTSGTAGPDGIHIDYGTSDLSSTAFPVGLTLDMASTTIGNSTFVYGVYLQGNAGTAPAQTTGLIVDSGWDMGIQLANTASMWLSNTSRLLFGNGGNTAQTAGDMQIRYKAGVGVDGIYIEESSVLGAGGGNGHQIALISQPGGAATGVTNAGVGGALNLSTGDGGDAGAGTGNSGRGGDIVVSSGIGGAADATGPEDAAQGGSIQLTSGRGGAGAGAGAAGVGGLFDINGGTGGAGTATVVGGSGGDVTLDGGAGGATGGVGAGTEGAITIGTSLAGAITVGGAQSGAVKVSTAAGNDSAILALSALGASGEAFSIYGGSNAPTASADAGSTFFRDTGTGAEAYLNTSNAGSGTTWSRIVVDLTVEAKTATYAVDATNDQGRAFTNEGSTGAANLRPFNLPTAVAGAGFTFITQDADLLRIVAAAGDTIRLGSTVSGVAGNIESTAIGDVVELIAINATEWIARSIVGTWTVN